MGDPPVAAQAGAAPWAKPSPTRDGALPDATLEGAADASRVAADVATLAAAPRGRHHPAQMHRAQSYVTEQLTTAGWQVRSVLFTRRWVLGVSDAGGRSSFLRRLRLFPRLTGINLLADLPGASAGRRVLIVAHLD